jgi:hypothetical protein
MQRFLIATFSIFHSGLMPAACQLRPHRHLAVDDGGVVLRRRRRGSAPSSASRWRTSSVISAALSAPELLSMTARGGHRRARPHGRTS